MIAMEKPNAIITSSALIFRLAIFLKALLTMPKRFPSEKSFADGLKQIGLPY
jgi:hypothetical protein